MSSLLSDPKGDNDSSSSVVLRPILPEMLLSSLMAISTNALPVWGLQKTSENCLSRVTAETPAVVSGKISETGAGVDMEQRAFALIPYRELDLATWDGDCYIGTLVCRDASFLAAAVAREAFFFTAAAATLAACARMPGWLASMGAVLAEQLFNVFAIWKGLIWIWCLSRRID